MFFSTTGAFNFYTLNYLLKSQTSTCTPLSTSFLEAITTSDRVCLKLGFIYALSLHLQVNGLCTLEHFWEGNTRYTTQTRNVESNGKTGAHVCVWAQMTQQQWPSFYLSSTCEYFHVKSKSSTKDFVELVTLEMSLIWNCKYRKRISDDGKSI